MCKPEKKKREWDYTVFPSEMEEVRRGDYLTPKDDEMIMHLV